MAFHQCIKDGVSSHTCVVALSYAVLLATRGIYNVFMFLCDSGEC